MKTHLRSVGQHLMACPRTRAARQAAPPGQRRDAFVTAPRVGIDHLRRDRHHIAHRAVEIEPALDMVLRHLADLAGGDVGQRRQVIQTQRDGRVGSADTALVRQHDRERQRHRSEFLFEQRVDRTHG